MTFLANYRAARRRIAELNSRLVVLTVANEFAAQHPLSSSVPAGLGMPFTGSACVRAPRQFTTGTEDTIFSARDHATKQSSRRGTTADDWVMPAPRTTYSAATEGATCDGRASLAGRTTFGAERSSL